jgi:hypothetical protein
MFRARCTMYRRCIGDLYLSEVAACFLTDRTTCDVHKVRFGIELGAPLDARRNIIWARWTNMKLSEMATRPTPGKLVQRLPKVGDPPGAVANGFDVDAMMHQVALLMRETGEAQHALVQRDSLARTRNPIVLDRVVR